MELKLEVENGLVSARLTSKSYDSSFKNLTRSDAVDMLEIMIAEEKESRRTIRDKIIEQIDTLEIDDVTYADTLDLSIAEFRVRLSVISRSLGMKLKTKNEDGDLLIHRIS